MTVTTAGTPEKLAPSGLRAKVVVQAFHHNTDLVAIGGEPFVTDPKWQIVTNGPKAASGSQEGYLLNPGERFPFPLELDDVWGDVRVNGEGFNWVVVSE